MMNTTNARKIRSVGLAASTALVAACAASQGAFAQVPTNPLFDVGPISLTWQANAAAAVFAVPNAQFGSGVADPRDTTKVTRDPTWGEFFVKPAVTASYHSSIGSLYAVGSAVYAQTIGDGEAGGNGNFGGALASTTATPGNPGKLALEEAYLGWSDQIGSMPVVVQAGRQNFTVDDGFLIADGTLDVGHRGAYYMAPRTAFDGWGVVKLNGDPIRADFFALRTTYDGQLQSDNAVNDYPQTSFAGFNVQWFENASGATADGSVNYADRSRYISLTYFNIYEAKSFDPNNTHPFSPGGYDRTGMNVVSGSIGGTVLPDFDDSFTFYGQYVRELRGAQSSDGFSSVDAEAYFVEPGYTFSDLFWSPKVYYRYSYFSGNNSNGGTDRTAYDPLFYGVTPRMSFGGYFMGEIGGQYGVFNSNEFVHQVGVKFSPSFHLLDKGDSIAFDAIYYNYNFDKLPAGVSDRHYADAVEFGAEYSLNPQTYIATALGVEFPAKGAQQAGRQILDANNVPQNLNQPTYIFEAYVTYAF